MTFFEKAKFSFPYFLTFADKMPLFVHGAMISNDKIQ